ncbi:putative olfactory receptor 2B8 [Discoglossus pictus]
MGWKNDTVVSEFILLGLSSNPKIQSVLFFVFLIIYTVILTGNSLIIAATITDKGLQTPMYFFLTNLSLLDLCYSTSIVPRMLRDLLSVNKNISFIECIAQIYISLTFGEAECILLAVMAYDRYVAICYPLHYTTIINRLVCIRIAAGTWLCGLLLPIPLVAVTVNVNLCGKNEINHFECEIPGIISLGCGNVAILEFMVFVAGVIVLMIPVTFIVISYFKIIRAILKIATAAGQKKAFYTCGSHMIVVTIFYGSCMATYMKPGSTHTPETDKMIAVFYTIITPMLNPLIYTLRNKEVKNALKNIRSKNVIFLQM